METLIKTLGCSVALLGVAAFIISSVTFTSCSHDNIETIDIGEQTWMKFNLNVVPTSGKNNVATNSWCYDDEPANCEKYGRLYDWATAMALPASCNEEECVNQISTPHQGICPKGFHIPNNADWNELYYFVDGTSIGADYNENYDAYVAGKHLKAYLGWSSCGSTDADTYKCLDTYGFSALPGGARDNGGDFYDAERYSYWWGAEEDDSYRAYGRFMGYSGEIADWSYNFKSYNFSVRCIKN